MKVSATKIFTFDACHFLPGHNGKCANMHGHTYKLEVTVTRMNKQLIAEGSSRGMIMDFTDLKRIVNACVIDLVDHADLTKVYRFRTTAENMAIHIFETLNHVLSNQGVEVTRIKLWETPTSFAEVCK